MASIEKICGPCKAGKHTQCLDDFWRQLSGSTCGCLLCEKIRADAEEEAWKIESEREDA